MRSGGKTTNLRAISGKVATQPVVRRDRIAERDAPFDRFVAHYASLIDPMEALRASLDLLATDAGGADGRALAVRQVSRLEASLDQMADAVIELGGVLAADVDEGARR